MSNHMLALDLETTGLPQHNPSVIEIGAVHYNGEQRVSEFTIKMQPDWSKNIALQALRCNKADITDLMTRPPHSKGAEAFVNYLVQTVFPVVGNKKISILGQNVGFDIQLLKGYLTDHKVCDWESVFEHKIIDTAVLGQFLRDTGIITVEKLGLETLAEALKIEVEQEKLHTGLYDAELSAKCYFAMLKLVRANYGKGE